MSIAIVAAIAGIAGVLLGGVLQLEASRRGDLRNAQLTSASEFSATAVTVFMALDRMVHRVGPLPDDLEGQAAWLAESKAGREEAREEARMLLTRSSAVALAFGIESRPAQIAAALVQQIVRLLDKAGKVKVQADVVAVVKEYESAVEAIDGFNLVAHKTFARPLWRRDRPPSE